MRDNTTNRTSMAPLVVSALLAIASPTFAVAGDVGAERIEINGKIAYDDGEPIRGANVLLLEGHPPRDGNLPAFTPFARAVTDANGAFQFDVDRKLAVIIELVRDKCEWFSARTSIDDQQLKSAKAITLEITSTRDVCGEVP